MSELENVNIRDAEDLKKLKHSKKIAKQKAEAEKLAKKFQKVFFFLNGKKVLRAMVKHNGVYKSYIGNISKKTHVDGLKIAIEDWKEAGQWLEGSELQIKEMLSKEVAEMADLYSKSLSKKKASKE